MDEKYKLPPLTREKIPVMFSPGSSSHSRIDDLLTKAVNAKQPWPNHIALLLYRIFLRITTHFGNAFPYILRPWYWLSNIVTRRLDKRFKQRKVETVKTLFLRRLFNAKRSENKQFHTSFAIANWATILVLLPLVPSVIGILLEGIYVYSTGDTYYDVVVTQAYRNITDQSTYAVHGYQEQRNGEKRELYFEIGSNVWHWNLYPEFLFGQVPVLGRCKFDTFGITLRIPRKLRMFSHGSLYVLNPWIIDMKCTSPTIVPE